MKNKTVSGIALAILGLLLSIAPNFLISQHCMNMKMKCFWTARMEFGAGALILILALLFIFIDLKEIRSGISLSLASMGVFSALIPTVLIGACNGSCGMECTCSPVSSIAMTILSVLVVLISIINFIQLNKKG